MTERQPVPCEGGLAVGEVGRILLHPGVDVTITPVPVSDPRLRTAWPDTIWKISLYFYKTITLSLR